MSTVARRLPGILPPLTLAEAVAVTPHIGEAIQYRSLDRRAGSVNQPQRVAG